MSVFRNCLDRSKIVHIGLENLHLKIFVVLQKSLELSKTSTVVFVVYQCL